MNVVQAHRLAVQSAKQSHWPFVKGIGVVHDTRMTYAVWNMGASFSFRPLVRGERECKIRDVVCA